MSLWNDGPGGYAHTGSSAGRTGEPGRPHVRGLLTKKTGLTPLWPNPVALTPLTRAQAEGPVGSVDLSDASPQPQPPSYLQPSLHHLPLLCSWIPPPSTLPGPRAPRLLQEALAIPCLSYPLLGGPPWPLAQSSPWNYSLNSWTQFSLHTAFFPPI